MTARTGFRRTAWIGLAAAISALALVAGILGWAVNPARLKPRMEEAVWRATGRTLTISGRMGIKLSLVPTISMQDVTLSNPPGFSRPDMVKVARVELGLALMPLLRHRLEVDRVTLIRPDIVMETDAAGHSNWVFARQPPISRTVPPAATTPAPSSMPIPAAPPTPPPPGPPKRHVSVTFKDANVVDGTFGWIDGKARHSYVAKAPSLTIDAPRDGPVRLAGTLIFDGQTIRLTGQTEPTELPGAAPGTGPWPVALRLETGGASLTADGQIADLHQGRGYTIALNANVPDPSVLTPFFPRLPLAALHDVTAHAELSDGGGPASAGQGLRLPAISALDIRAGSVDLAKFRQGARLENATVTGRGDGPVTVAAGVSMGGVNSQFNGTIGDLPWLAKGAAGPVAVDLRWNGASAQGSVKGTIQTPARFAGLNLAVAIDVPDPSLVMNDAPPAVKSVMFRGRLTDLAGPVPFQLTSTAGDLAGTLSVSRKPRLTVDGQVWSRYLDLDALLGRPSAGAGPGRAIPAPAANGQAANGQTVLRGEAPGEAGQRQVGQGQTGQGQASQAAPRAPAPTAASPAPSAPAGGAAPAAANGPLIPATALPFDLIRAVDGAVKFHFSDVRVDAADIRKIEGAVTAKDGLLRVDPFTIAAPDQRLNGLFVADASKPVPSVHIALAAPGLGLWPLLAALGLPQAATGTVAVQADLTGTGDTPRAIAASLDGWAGVAIEGGQLDARMVNSWLDQLKPLHIGGANVTDLRCLAVRGDAKDGVVTIKPIAMSTPALIIEGDGEVDLRDETLALRLRPRARIGGTGIALPVRVSGPLRSPSARIDISAKGFGGGALAGLLLGGKDIMGAAGGGDPCPAALASARQGSAMPGGGMPGEGEEPAPPAAGQAPRSGAGR